MLRKRVPIPLASRGDTTLGQGSSNNSAVPGICIGRELSVLDDSKFESALQHLQYCRDSESNDKQQGPQVNRDDANKCSVCCEMTVMGRVSAASVDSMVIVDNVCLYVYIYMSITHMSNLMYTLYSGDR